LVNEDVGKTGEREEVDIYEMDNGDQGAKEIDLDIRHRAREGFLYQRTRRTYPNTKCSVFANGN
jgi:hypothetical protein